jgi:NADH-quinone oxidoreductase subunit C
MASDLLSGRFPTAVLNVEEFRGETNITVDGAQLHDVMVFLKASENLAYDLLLDLAGIDCGSESPRFLVAYLLHSTKYTTKLRVKVQAAEGAALDSVSDIWKAADWMEREAYDMFGIPFANHPNLQRILLTEEFTGYPLRKDFPLEGPDFGKPFTVCLEEER